MALIVKSSIDILPWTEIEKQKLIEDKKDFLSKKAEKETVEVKEEVKKEEVKETEVAEENKKVKNSTDKKQNKKEVKK
jgi:hypothetical protein